MDKKKILIGLSIFLTFVLIYFMTGISSSNEVSDKEAIAALIGGGGIQGSGESSNDSLFGSNFWNAGVPDKAIDTSNVETVGDDTGLLDPASEGNPVNPQTGQPYPDSVMNQFAALREKFPDNKIIPRRLTPEQKAQEDAKKEKMQDIQSKLARNDVLTESEINDFYDHEVKVIDDRLELLSYVFETQGESMDEDIKQKFQSILELNQKQKSSNEELRKQALEKQKNRK